MKKIQYKLSLLLLILCFTNCNNYLDVVPENIAVIEDAFETRDNAYRFLATIYGYIPNHAGTNFVSLTSGDEILVNERVSRTWPAHIIAKGGQNVNSPLLNAWGSGVGFNMFIALRDCNIFLENVDKPFDLQPEEGDRWIAEVKALKAFFHYWIMRQYGPIPIIRENIEVSESLEGVRVTRDPLDEVVDYCIELLNEADSSFFLPDKIEDLGLELGRLTRPAVKALKAEILTWAASPLFNGNPDYQNFVDAEGRNLINPNYDESKWQRAADACREAIESAEVNGHSLYYFPERDFPDASDTTYIKLTLRGSLTEPWNEEIIWGHAASVMGVGMQRLAQGKINPGLRAETRESTQSYWSPPLRIAEQFYSNNGVPIDEDIDYNYAGRYDLSVAGSDHRHYIKTGATTANLHFNREPRFYAFIGFDTGIWEGHGRSESESYHLSNKRGEIGGAADEFRYPLSGYLAKKIVHYTAVQSADRSSYTTESYPFPLMRLTHLYLMYAECLNEIGQIQEAQQWVNIIRERAGLEGVVESWSNFSINPDKPNSKDGMREIIHQERLNELCFEGHRFWDLRRWKKAENFMNSPYYGWNIQGDEVESYYNVVKKGDLRFSSRDYLWPISEYDLITNPNLIQNPGW